VHGCKNGFRIQNNLKIKIRIAENAPGTLLLTQKSGGFRAAEKSRFEYGSSILISDFCRANAVKAFLNTFPANYFPAGG